MNHSTVSASTASAQTFSIKKTALAGMLVALTVALSGFSIPIGASKCFPIQHLVNVLAGVFLGPVYGVSMAFCVSLIRNILGTGSLLAFPGSMVGAFLGAYLFQKTGRFLLAYQTATEPKNPAGLPKQRCHPVYPAWRKDTLPRVRHSEDSDG